MNETPKIVIMAKAPRPGQVKTRLAPIFDDSQLVKLQATLIQTTMKLALSVAPLNTFLCFDPTSARKDLARLVGPRIRLVPQRGDHLGQRLMSAANDVYELAPGPQVIIGTDIPLLSEQLLRSACSHLRSGIDVVLGPAVDGGYYLVAMNRPELSLFDIDPTLWGGAHVLEATLAASEKSGLSVRLLEQLRDLDTPHDARELVNAPSLPAALRSLLRQADPTLRGTYVAL